MLAGVMEKVLVVGTGITGAVTAALLRSQLPESISICLWDKAKGAGGRMSTSRSPVDPECTVDLGAQYISSSPSDYQKHHSVYTELEKEGLLSPLTHAIEGFVDRSDGTKHFVTPKGVGSLVKHFINKSGIQACYQHTVTEVTEDIERWRVQTQEGVTESFDCVVLTLPIPQILQLKGTIKQLLAQQSEIKKKMERVTYSSRYAVGLFYKPGTTIDVPWCAKYFADDSCIRFVAIDNKKRHVESPDIGPSVVIHTSVPFGVQNLEGNVDAVCSNMVVPRARLLIPELPKPSATKNQKWRYSQVHKGYEGSPGALMLHKRPLLICAGDAFAGSRFDYCMDSALTVADIVTREGKLQS